MSTRRFERNTTILSKYFDDISNMTGIIVKIEVEEPYNNYTKIFGDPSKEQTLQICGDNDMMLFYKADNDGRTPRQQIIRGVTVMTSYRLTMGDVVRMACPPIALPVKLEEQVFPNLCFEPLYGGAGLCAARRGSRYTHPFGLQAQGKSKVRRGTSDMARSFEAMRLVSDMPMSLDEFLNKAIRNFFFFFFS